MSTALVACAAVAVLFTSVGLKFSSTIRLMQNFRVDEYLASPKARRLYWTSTIAPVFTGSAIVTLAYLTRFWWVEAAAWGVAIFIGYGIAWRLRMRFSGRYAEFYRQHQWR